MSDENKCCFCGKGINLNEKVIPPTWYGKFEGNHGLIAVICDKCITIPENLKKWQSFEK